MPLSPTSLIKHDRQMAALLPGEASKRRLTPQALACSLS
jgi:hypothetical protein